MSKKLTFSIKSATTTSKRELDPKNVKDVFDTNTEQQNLQLKSRSIITALDAKGFHASSVKTYLDDVKIIKCANDIPPPVQFEPKIKYIEVIQKSDDNSENTKKEDSNEVLTSVNAKEEDLGPLVNKNMQGLHTNSHSSVLLAKIKPELFQLRKSNRNSEATLFKKELEYFADNKYIDFDNMPVADFGMAMLRGMGYDSRLHTSQPHDSKKRVYARAGLGADSEFEKIQASYS